MKSHVLYVLLLFLLVNSCSRATTLKISSSVPCYIVTKIDVDIENKCYLIYAVHKGNSYKIVSEIELLTHYGKGEEIKVGNCYHLLLTSNYEIFEKIFGVKLMYGDHMEMEYYAKNLKGLWLIE